MFQYKRWCAGALALVMTASLAACGGDNNKGATAQGEPDLGAAAGDAALTAWEQSSGIFNTDETDAELYELAKQEGSVTLYSLSSRSNKVVEAFNAKYPGVTAETFVIPTNELLEKVTREYDAGQHVADVVHIKDEDGTIYNEYILNKRFYNFQPADILGHMQAQDTALQTPLYIELTQVFYNNETYADGAPIDSLWDLTRPEWKGRVMLQNPLDNLSRSSWSANLCLPESAALLEASYEEEFGEKLALSDGCENAGYEFFKRLQENDPIIATSDDEMAESIGARGQANPPIGILSSTKLRKAADNDWALAPISDIKPTTGVPTFNSLYVVEGCAHPNAAKLLIRFMLGGVDGDLSGYEPFNTLGGWPVRDDIEPAEGSTPLSESKLTAYDPMGTYDIIRQFQDFWTMLG